MKRAYTIYINLDKIREELNIDYSLIDDRTLLFILILIGKQTVFLSQQKLTSEKFYKMLKNYIVFKKHI